MPEGENVKSELSESDDSGNVGSDGASGVQWSAAFALGEESSDEDDGGW